MQKTGVAFGDYISSGKSKRRNYDNDPDKISKRELFIPLIFIILFTILSLRIIYLQVVKGFYYRDLSNNNRTGTLFVHAPRGIIFDRNNTPLVYNVPGFRENVKGKTHFLTKDEALSLIAKGRKNLEVDVLRQYPYREEFAHVLGFLGQISKDQLETPAFLGYRGTDIVGKDGIEQEYEALLKGVDGKELFEVNARGQVLRQLGRDDPIAGRNITLTLDLNLQRAAYTAMKDVSKGAVIVSTPKGEILALVSKPTFDPNLFTMGSHYKAATESGYKTLEDVLTDGVNQPLLNRAISGVYPPGSTFKLVVASAALKNKIIDENYQVEDTGILKVGNFSFANWYYTEYGGKDDEVNVVKALRRSNDIFFYKLAEKVGIEEISKTAAKFGVGKKLGIDLRGEQSGTLPSKEWKLKNIGEQWYLGDTYHYGIGQGFLLTTPLQVNGWTQAIANNGNLYTPFLFKNQNPHLESKDLLDKHSLELIRQGMIEACNPGGVAWPLYDFKVKNTKLKIDNSNFTQVASVSADMRHVSIACKTGTAEAPNSEKPHAWITLYAPAFNPQIVVTVLSERSGEGSNMAAPVAKKILENWFSR